MSGRIRVSSPVARTMDGITFASRSEMTRYVELKMLERAGVIKDLELQPKYVLQPAFTDKDGKHHREIAYFADFRYLNVSTACNIVEDCKGQRTEVYKLKIKMLRYTHPDINFIETRAK